MISMKDILTMYSMGLMLCCRAADNAIKAEGGQALANALAPQKNPDGSWVYNNALSTLELKCAPSLHLVCCCLLFLVADASAAGIRKV